MKTKKKKTGETVDTNEETKSEYRQEKISISATRTEISPTRLPTRGNRTGARNPGSLATEDTIHKPRKTRFHAAAEDTDHTVGLVFLRPGNKPTWKSP